MILRILLLIIVGLSVLLVGLNASAIIDTFLLVTSSITLDAAFWIFVTLAVALQLMGHVIRSIKATVLFSPIEKSKTSTQLRAFSVGQLFNNLLPLRIGEFIRTAIISQKLGISYLYTFFMVVFERSIDAIIIASIGMIILLSIGGQFGSSAAYGLVVLLGTTGLLVLIAVVIFMRPPSAFLRLIYFVTSLFNDTLKNSIRFKLWSLSYGLSKTLTRETLKRYILMAFMMWTVYILSLVSIAGVLLGGGVIQVALGGIAPYIGIAAPAGPAGLGIFSSHITTILSTFDPQEVLIYGIVTWAVMIIPISIIGIISIGRTKEPLWKRRSRGSSDISLANKLVRNEDVSGELAHFLEGYFKGNKPSLVVNKLERRGDFSLVKYFRGGSDAITILALEKGRRVVKKIIPIELMDRLKAQYDWLMKYKGGVVVGTFGEQTGEDYYSIDISYDKTSVSLFDYVHEIPLDRAQSLLADAWRGLDESVYKDKREFVRDTNAIEGYIAKHVYECVKKAKEVDPDIARAMKKNKILINGIEYDNLDEIIKRIKRHTGAWSDICGWQSTGAIHGDMILDNLLYSRKSDQVIIIDPAPDGNVVEGPVFDFAKAAQSLYCGYEFLLRDETRVFYKDGGISFNENKSLRFSELDKFMRTELALSYLTPGEQRAILFHAGVLFLRRLKHQVYYTPGNALKFYAVGVRTLNQFLEQYENRS